MLSSRLPSTLLSRSLLRYRAGATFSRYFVSTAFTLRPQLQENRAAAAAPTMGARAEPLPRLKTIHFLDPGTEWPLRPIDFVGTAPSAPPRTRSVLPEILALQDAKQALVSALDADAAHGPSHSHSRMTLAELLDHVDKSVDAPPVESALTQLTESVSLAREAKARREQIEADLELRRHQAAVLEAELTLVDLGEAPEVTVVREAVERAPSAEEMSERAKERDFDRLVLDREAVDLPEGVAPQFAANAAASEHVARPRPPDKSVAPEIVSLRTQDGIFEASVWPIRADELVMSVQDAESMRKLEAIMERDGGLAGVSIVRGQPEPGMPLSPGASKPSRPSAVAA